MAASLRILSAVAVYNLCRGKPFEYVDPCPGQTTEAELAECEESTARSFENFLKLSGLQEVGGVVCRPQDAS